MDSTNIGNETISLKSILIGYREALEIISRHFCYISNTSCIIFDLLSDNLRNNGSF